MKGMYDRVYKMSRNEAFAVSAITFGVVVAYSVWGSFILHSQDPAITPQVITVER